MTEVKETTFFLLAILVALAWGAKDWIEWHWNTMSADSQIRWFAAVWLFFSLVFSRLFTPIVWQNLL